MNTNSPEGLAASAIVCTCVATIVNTYPNRKLIGYSYRLQLLDILPNLLIAVIMGVCVISMGQLNLSPFLLLIVQIATGAILYVVLSIVTRNSNFTYMLNILKQFIRRTEK